MRERQRRRLQRRARMRCQPVGPGHVLVEHHRRPPRRCARSAGQRGPPAADPGRRTVDRRRSTAAASIRTDGSTWPKRSMMPTGPKSGEAVLTTAPRASALRAKTTASRLFGVQAATRSPGPDAGRAQRRRAGGNQCAKLPAPQLRPCALLVESDHDDVIVRTRQQRVDDVEPGLGEEAGRVTPSPVSTTEPGSPTTPRSVQARDQNSSGCSTDHRCTSAKPVAPRSSISRWRARLAGDRRVGRPERVSHARFARVDQRPVTGT